MPRGEHGRWQPVPDRLNCLDLLTESNQGRLEQLIPIRYGRMLQSPFTFYRGAAAVMAYDLSSTPSTGVRVQACGDCHLMNFGLFATPERNLVFDLNDFDETLPAPWEWDVKRLVASIVVAARDVGHSEQKAREAAEACANSYRDHLREFSEMSPLDVWYFRIDADILIDKAPDEESRARRLAIGAKARSRIGGDNVDLGPKFGRAAFVEREGDTYKFRWQGGALKLTITELDATDGVRFSITRQFLGYADFTANHLILAAVHHLKNIDETGGCNVEAPEKCLAAAVGGG